MHARFFAPGLRAGDPTVQLPDDEAEHLTRVLRLAAGADVLVFEGRGLQRAGRVETADRRGVTVRLAGDVPAAAEPSVSLTLVQSLLKGHALDDIVRDAVM